jgi:succinate dehydrogenase / fumarate reductase membrane anchor subunit
MSGKKYREGPAHWWIMKLTSVALIPLGLWMLANLIQLAGMDQAGVQAWMRVPLHGAALGALLLVGLHHSAYGVQAVMEDYISSVPARRIALLISNALHLIVAAFSLFTILQVLGVGVSHG